MKVGDLVEGRLSLGGRMGLAVKVVSAVGVERFWLIRWNDGTLDTLSQRLLEVVSESR